MRIKHLKAYMILFLFTLIYISCETRNNSLEKDELIIRETFYKDGTIKTRQSFKNDSTADGFLKEYYSNGVLGLESEYKNGIKSGIEKCYYLDGKLKYIGWNQEGKADSLTTWYYPSGIAKAKYHLNSGKTFGEQIQYDSLGNMTFYYIDNFDTTIYVREYNKKGALVNEEGKPLFMYYNRNNLLLNEKFELMFFFAKLSHFRTQLILSKYNSHSFLISQDTFTQKDFTPHYGLNKYYNEQAMKEAGNYKWKLLLKMENTLLHNSRMDSLIINITVKK